MLFDTKVLSTLHPMAKKTLIELQVELNCITWELGSLLAALHI
jgi:hypothetical protein